MILLYRLQDSRMGRAWNAIREDELAAAANGINTVTTKLLAFALGATTAGLAGVFNASKLTIVSPDQFLFTVSFTVLAMVILGGMGNIWGVAAGAFIVFMIQTVVLKQINTVTEGFGIPILKDINFLDYQFLLYGIALVLMMLFRPEGLFPSQRRRRELHIAEEFTEGIGDEAAVEGGMGDAPGSDEMFGADQP
jgi:branched-chain amino acid transport system permease protein